MYLAGHRGRRAEEYFYGDWSKINLILGDRFVERKKQDNKVTWANGNKVFNSDFDVREIWKVTHSNTWNAEAFQSIYANITKEGTGEF